MKSVISLIFIALFFIQGKSQNYDFIPSNYYEKTADASGFSSDQVLINNLTTGVLKFKWKKIEVAFPSGWDYSLCDLGSCYPSVPDSATMNPTDSAGDAYFICHMTFNNVVDSGYLKLFVYEDGDEFNGDTVTYKYITTPPTGIQNYLMSSPTVFPNPASKYITIDLKNKSINSVKIYDVTGKIIFTDNSIHRNSYTINVNKFPIGLFFIHIEDLDGKLYVKPLTINN